MKIIIGKVVVLIVGAVISSPSVCTGQSAPPTKPGLSGGSNGAATRKGAPPSAQRGKSQTSTTLVTFQGMVRVSSDKLSDSNLTMLFQEVPSCRTFEVAESFFEDSYWSVQVSTDWAPAIVIGRAVGKKIVVRLMGDPDEANRKQIVALHSKCGGGQPRIDKKTAGNLPTIESVTKLADAASVSVRQQQTISGKIVGKSIAGLFDAPETRFVLQSAAKDYLISIDHRLTEGPSWTRGSVRGESKWATLSESECMISGFISGDNEIDAMTISENCGEGSGDRITGRIPIL